jgi:hypothetical protein
MKNSFNNAERHQQLKILLVRDTDGVDRLSAHKLVYEWVKTGTFGWEDFLMYVERVAAVSAGSKRQE